MNGPKRSAIVQRHYLSRCSCILARRRVPSASVNVLSRNGSIATTIEPLFGQDASAATPQDEASQVRIWLSDAGEEANCRAGLLPLLKSIQKPCNLKKFEGKTLGVDAYGWLHRGTAGCAIELALEKPTTKYVTLSYVQCTS